MNTITALALEADQSRRARAELVNFPGQSYLPLPCYQRSWRPHYPSWLLIACNNGAWWKKIIHQQRKRMSLHTSLLQLSLVRGRNISWERWARFSGRDFADRSGSHSHVPWRDRRRVPWPRPQPRLSGRSCWFSLIFRYLFAVPAHLSTISELHCWLTCLITPVLNRAKGEARLCFCSGHLDQTVKYLNLIMKIIRTDFL